LITEVDSALKKKESFFGVEPESLQLTSHKKEQI
jgi:hypothetical protein